MTVLSVVILSGLLLGAFYVPGLLNWVYDNQTLEQINTKELEFEIYKPAYTDFEEKVHAIGMAVADGAELAFIEVTEEQRGEEASVWEYVGFSEKNMKEELQLLFEEKLRIGLDVEQLVLSSCKLYTVFGTGKSSGNVLSGIQVYEMVYTPKEYLHLEKSGKVDKNYKALRLYVDTEFHKIYAFLLYALWDTVNVDLVDITEHGTEILTSYWGLGQKYKEGDITAVPEGYREGNGSWGGIYEEKLTFGSNAQIYLGLEGYVDNAEKVVRMGMQPFFDAFYSTFSVYDASD